MDQKKLEELLSQSVAILVEAGPRFGLTIAMLMAHITEKWGDRHVVKNPRDSRRENKLITGRCILIDIYKEEYEMRGKIYGKPFK